MAREFEAEVKMIGNNSWKARGSFAIRDPNGCNPSGRPGTLETGSGSQNRPRPKSDSSFGSHPKVGTSSLSSANSNPNRKGGDGGERDRDLLLLPYSKPPDLARSAAALPNPEPPDTSQHAMILPQPEPPWEPPELWKPPDRGQHAKIPLQPKPPAAGQLATASWSPFTSSRGMRIITEAHAIQFENKDKGAKQVICKLEIMFDLMGQAQKENSSSNTTSGILGAIIASCVPSVNAIGFLISIPPELVQGNWACEPIIFSEQILKMVGGKCAYRCVKGLEENATFYNFRGDDNTQICILTLLTSLSCTPTYEATDSAYNYHVSAYFPVCSVSVVGELKLSDPTDMFLLELPCVEMHALTGMSLANEKIWCLHSAVLIRQWDPGESNTPMKVAACEDCWRSSLIFYGLINFVFDRGKIWEIQIELSPNFSSLKKFIPIWFSSKLMPLPDARRAKETTSNLEDKVVFQGGGNGRTPGPMNEEVIRYSRRNKIEQGELMGYGYAPSF